MPKKESDSTNALQPGVPPVSKSLLNQTKKTLDTPPTSEKNQAHPTIFSKLTIGQKSSDLLTSAMGSWFFILLFAILLALWMSANVYAWINQWDPYPFILLNLVLSCLAAIQAPIILMSQNRTSEKDRARQEYDYAVNRKAEREIQELKKQLNRIEKKITP
tara:strand:- start:1660 stop:2142 length:483 start_codon:yes stop_codon:yes gene_type:complete